ncbi:MAG: hypothetical protein HONBIEJF_02425 [Fimbriimonadaceae bacterium]|nr:hypothetical protein [Fimbriimonadaceae bacterium]
MSEEFSRRELMRRSGMIAVGLVTPPWLSTIAKADVLRQSKGGKVDPNTILVVVQLSGGNDGLNTIIPYSDSKYRELRPNLAIADSAVLKIDDKLGMHPGLGGLKTLYDEKKVAVIQGVGYPKANRSHFKSMEIWQSASPDGKLSYGWIGRHFDERLSQGTLNPVVALGLSTDKPRSLSAKSASIPCFASLADIQNMVGDPDAEKMLRQIQGAESTNADVRVIQQANNTALDAMTALRDKLAKFEPKQTYGTDPFGVGFKQIAQLVATSPQTRVIYFSAGGFDTHARQADQHQRLLDGFSKGLFSFQREIEALGLDKKVVVMVFSEFGRRTYENASAGTDHGAAAPMFLVGSGVKGGMYGPIPNLNDLDDGDVKFAIDFRQVYATALDGWLGGTSEVVLGSKFQNVEIWR